MLLEICAYNIQSCLVAEKGGAGRVELCADPLQGGTTPSYGVIRYALDHISIPVFPIIRPRGGNFVYDSDELAIMKEDILHCRELGCPGISVGVLQPDNRVDTEAMKRIVDWAHPMSVTYHNAFNQTPDPFQALEEIISAGCSRILTSGQKARAIDGVDLLAQLVTRAAGRIIIMPGGSVRSSLMDKLLDTQAIEYHSSAITQADGQIADIAEVQAIVSKLRSQV